MTAPKTGLMSPFAMAALWLGAAVSMAEILTGGLLAGMERSNALLAIVGGHAVGAVIFFLVARLSWRSDRGAIAVCSDVFGRFGTVLFGGLNVIQLLGWTVVMIITGADSVNHIVLALGGPAAPWLWRLLLGSILVLWLVLGLRHDSLITKLAAVLLLILTAVSAVLLLGGSSSMVAAGATAVPALRFGDGLELVLIMPLSWLPLVGDYTRPSRAAGRACAVAAIAYAIGSSWMYLVGYGTVAATGNADPVLGLMGRVGSVGGLLGLAVVVLSTVTTAFLDVLSAGISAKTVHPGLPEDKAALAIALIGTTLALVVPMDQYQNFLYLIGSVFAPLYAVLLVSGLTMRWQTGFGAWLRGSLAMAAWAAGLALYYLLLPIGTGLGVSIPVMAAVAVLHSILVLGAWLWKKSFATAS